MGRSPTQSRQGRTTSMLNGLLIGMALTIGQVQPEPPPAPTAPKQPDAPAQLPSSSAPAAPAETNDKPSSGPAEEKTEGLLFRRLFRAYADEFKPKKDDQPAEQTPEVPRRALPAPFD